MRPDDIRVGMDEPAGGDIPIAADLRPLDAELSDSGVRARRMLHGRTQPTNYFAMDLRAQLLSAYSGDEAAGSATLNVPVPRSQAQAAAPYSEPRRNGTTMMAPLVPRPALAVPSIPVGARWAFLVAAVAMAALIAGAFGSGVIPR
jgi:hypothetical protein